MDLKKLGGFVNNPLLWTNFEEYVDHQLSIYRRELETLSSLEEIYRAQGKIKAFVTLKKLRDSVNG